MDYSTSGRGNPRSSSATAAAVVIQATDDPRQGERTRPGDASDGEGWKDIFIPTCPADFPDCTVDPASTGSRSDERATVFKFAVGTFPEIIAQTLSGPASASDVDICVCHQSNARILAAARERSFRPKNSA